MPAMTAETKTTMMTFNTLGVSRIHILAMGLRLAAVDKSTSRHVTNHSMYSQHFRHFEGENLRVLTLAVRQTGSCRSDRSTRFRVTNHPKHSHNFHTLGVRRVLTLAIRQTGSCSCTRFRVTNHPKYSHNIHTLVIRSLCQRYCMLNGYDC